MIAASPYAVVPSFIFQMSGFAEPLIHIQRGQQLLLRQRLAREVRSVAARFENVSEDTEGDLRVLDELGQSGVADVVRTGDVVERGLATLPRRPVNQQHHRIIARTRTSSASRRT